jgi:hypothetical protein
MGVTRQPGHVLTFLPGLLLLVAVAAAQIKESGAFAVVTATICLTNAAVFLAWPRTWDGVFGGMGRTAREIRQHEMMLERDVELIRTRYVPADTVVCHLGEYLKFGLRHFQLYLPEFDECEMDPDPSMLTPPGKPLMSVHDGHLGFASDIDREGKRVAVLVVRPQFGVKIFRGQFDLTNAKEIAGSEGTLYEVPLARPHE